MSSRTVQSFRVSERSGGRYCVAPQCALWRRVHRNDFMVWKGRVTGGGTAHGSAEGRAAVAGRRGGCAPTEASAAGGGGLRCGRGRRWARVEDGRGGRSPHLDGSRCDWIARSYEITRDHARPRETTQEYHARSREITRDDHARPCETSRELYAVSWFSRSLSAARFLLAASLSSFFCSASTSLE